MSGLTQRLTQTEFEKGLEALIIRSFAESGEFAVIEERRLYNPYADEEIWKQNRGDQACRAEVSYQNEYLCDITSDMQPDQALALIEKRLLERLTRIHSDIAPKKGADKDAVNEKPTGTTH